MTNQADPLAVFMDAYLDYLEGLGDRPSSDDLTETERSEAETFIASLAAARGIDPYASRPSIADLTARAAMVSDTAADGIDAVAESLQGQLREKVDSEADVIPDFASAAAGIESDLLIYGRGLRIRGLLEPAHTDLDAAYPGRVSSVAAIFGAYPDTSAVLLMTTGPTPTGVIVDRHDVVDAIETPSGKERPPRIRRPITDPVVACHEYLVEALPFFEAFDQTMLVQAYSSSDTLDTDQLAAQAINEIVTSGRRARIHAKRDTWSELGEAEIASIAALIVEATTTQIPADDYRRRIESIIETAA
jgi:hypothetical protein